MGLIDLDYRDSLTVYYCNSLREVTNYEHQNV